VGSGQTTAAIAAAGRYGEILQGLCADAQAPIMNDAFARAAALAHELGGMAKPTGAGAGEMGVALFATPEARDRFCKACSDPLRALAGDLDTGGVRCEFPDNAVVADLDERDSAEIPDAEPDEFDMPTVKTASPIAANLNEAVTARNPAESEPEVADSGPGEKPARSRHWLVLVLVGLALALAGGLGWYHWLRPPVPVARPSLPERSQPAAPTSVPPTTVEEEPSTAPSAAVPVPAPAEETQPATDSETPSAPIPRRKPPGRAGKSRAHVHRAGTLSADDF
jgi:hypothetical protein